MKFYYPVIRICDTSCPMKGSMLAPLLFIVLAALAGPAIVPRTADSDDAKRITLFLPETDWPPYVTTMPDHPEGGIFAEVLRAVAEPMGYTVRVEFLPDRRGWEMLDSGQVDVHVKARKWVVDPDRYRWSGPFLEHQDTLLYPAARTLEYTSPEALYGKSVAAIRGFRYPVFEPHFGPGRITRVDVTTPFAMLDLLERDRVDAALVNRAETQWMLNHTPQINPDRFRLDERDFDTARYRFVFSPARDWQPFIEQFNQGLEAMKQDGRLQAILDEYK